MRICGRSGRHLNCLLHVVVGQSGISPLEKGTQVSIKSTGARLQQQMRAARRPLHLLVLGKAFAHDGVHRGPAKHDEMGSPLRNRSPSLIRLAVLLLI
jgi:hypothetical protein